MRSKKALIALSTALALGVLGAGSVAQASDHENQSGGYKIGPLGQVFGAPTELGAGANAYAYVPSKHTVHKPTMRSPASVLQDNYGPEAGKD
jgi:hypothetical protein